VLAVLPTGSGKSVAFFGAAILHPHNLFIVVTPFVALTEDLDRRLAATPIRGGQWPSIQDPLSAQIVIVPAHMAGTEQFYNWAEANSNRLKRIFIDKAHHFFTQTVTDPVSESSIASHNYRNL
jgi:superfamily II DNA helicase RecQ